VQDSATAVVAEFASSLEFDSIPSNVLEGVKLYLLDTIGCGLYGATDRRSRILSNIVKRLAGKPSSTVWNSSFRGSPLDAGLCNGTFVHCIDFDDQCQEAGLHAGSCVVPAALGVAEFIGNVTGREFLTALVAGYETAIRVGLSIGLEPVKTGWHLPGFNGTFGAAAAAGRVLRLDTKTMTNALGLGATQGAGLMSVQYGSDAKGMHCGKACQSGIYGALLARDGFKGIPDVLEAKYGGYCVTLNKDYNLMKTLDGLGERYITLEKLALKAYPGVRMIHAAVEAVGHLVEENSISRSDVKEVTVQVTTLAKNHVGWEFNPEGVTSALSNLSYGVAVMLVKGTIGPEHYTDESIRDEEVLKMTKMVKVQGTEEMDAKGSAHMGAKVTIYLTDGRSFVETIENPKGTPGVRPMTKQDVVSKFRRLVANDERSYRIIEVVEKIEEMNDVSAFATLLA